MLDQFSIAVDPVTTMRIEDVLKELKKEVTILLVTNLVHGARLADRTAFFLEGRSIDVADTGFVHRRKQGSTLRGTTSKEGLGNDWSAEQTRNGYKSRDQHPETEPLVRHLSQALFDVDLDIKQA